MGPERVLKSIPVKRALLRSPTKCPISLPKAKELRPKIDKAITLGKTKNLQSKKNLFAELQSKESVDKLSKILSQRYEKKR